MIVTMPIMELPGSLSMLAGKNMPLGTVVSDAPEAKIIVIIAVN